MVEFPLIPTRTALINVDMQRCFVQDGPLASPDGRALTERVNRLAAVCRRAGMLVVHTRMRMRADGSNLGVMGEVVPPFIVGLYTDGAESAELDPGLVVDAGDVIVDKPRYGGFHGTDLEMILRSRGVETVIITGIATNICCETTAREAAQRDFHVIFLNDGTATMEMNGVPADDLQRATCASLRMVFAQIATIDGVTEMIRDATGTADTPARNAAVEIRPADSSRIAHIAEVIGRAFVTEPMMTWPLGGRTDDLEERCIRYHALFVAPLMGRGIVWESTDGHGALVLVPPEQQDALDDALTHVDDSRTHNVFHDGGRRYELFWEWVASKIPCEPFWHLDSVAVAPGWQGRGIGSALIEFGLEQARESGTAMVLETGTERNVPLYERLGFHVVEEADSPEGGPHVWFMRRDP